MNTFCENFCYPTGADEQSLRRKDFVSPLSTSVPVDSCFYIGNGAYNTDNSVDKDMTDNDDIDKTPYDEEEMALREAFRQMNVNEQHSADQVVLGTSSTGSTAANGTMGTTDDEIQEEHKKLSQKFVELEETIRRIAGEQGVEVDPDFGAYLLAREINPQYVTSPHFTTGFLRAEDYDTEKAAQRMFSYLKIKLELFGKERLTRDILLSDLGQDGMDYLASGALQVLPKRDTSGRRVVFGVGRLNGSRSKLEAMSAKKAYFYFWTSASEGDTERGKIKGIAGILWRVHKPPMPDAELAEALRRIWMNVPMKISAYHMAYGPMTFDGFAKMNLAWFKNKHIMRYRRAHFDPAMNIMYTMMSKYGMPSECFPVNHATLNVTLAEATTPLFHTDNHDIWMQQRMALDREKLTLLTSVTSSRGSVDVTALLNSLRSSGVSMRTSGLSMTMDMSFSSFNGSGEFSGGLDDALIGGPLSANTNRDSFDMMKDITRISGATRNSIGMINGLIAEDELAATDDLLEDDNSFDEALNESKLLSESLLNPVSDRAESDIEDHDIKFGRGKPLQRHPGNIWFRTLISDHFEEYNSMDKKKQTEFSRHIVDAIKKKGRRFWKEQEGGSGIWVLVDDDAAREKVSITFRTERKKRIKKEEDRQRKRQRTLD